MRKILLVSLMVCMGIFQLPGQYQVTIQDILLEIEQNNPQLQALSKYHAAEKLRLKSGNTIPDPVAGLYYLPFGQHSTGDYFEFEVSQTVEFPTVYRARHNVLEQRSAEFTHTYMLKRQEVLLKAKLLCLHLISLNKKLDIERDRVENAERVYDHVRLRYEQEEVGILEEHRARLTWMDEQFGLQQLETEREQILMSLISLNGGKAIDYIVAEYEELQELPPLDSIWAGKLADDPEIALLRQEESTATQEIDLSRQMGLPDLTAGFNYQGVENAGYSGIYAGVSIPLWNNRYQVDAAKALLKYRQSRSASLNTEKRSRLSAEYRAYKGLFDNYQDYRSTLTALNSDDILIKAYQLGEISYLEYFMELQFYRQAYDTMLEMEFTLQTALARIFNHQL